MTRRERPRCDAAVLAARGHSGPTDNMRTKEAKPYWPAREPPSAGAEWARAHARAVLAPRGHLGPTGNMRPCDSKPHWPAAALKADWAQEQPFAWADWARTTAKAVLAPHGHVGPTDNMRPSDDKPYWPAPEHLRGPYWPRTATWGRRAICARAKASRIGLHRRWKCESRIGPAWPRGADGQYAPV